MKKSKKDITYIVWSGYNIEDKTSFFIGVDTYDKGVFVYELFRKKDDGVTELLLSKRMTDEKQFDEEVNNISKYFNININNHFKK